MKRILKKDILLIVTALGVGSGPTVFAAEPAQCENKSLGKLEHKKEQRLSDEKACGKGSCGKDEKGAEAARKKHSRKTAKAKDTKKPEEAAQSKDEKSEEKKD